eukprot:comp21855_c0_seq1/m.49429 comp21855_c0_seq1/g.49429  ORF comp21855_c0_seq1/g.49429 comp21855_c0_seq1/m.49429 type:complete len:488 (-) comp21855_c0_seq1:72-1535(-)
MQRIRRNGVVVERARQQSAAVVDLVRRIVGIESARAGFSDIAGWNFIIDDADSVSACAHGPLGGRGGAPVRELGAGALAIAKVRDLIHVDPESIERELLVEDADLGLPVCACVWVHLKVWEIHKPRPHFPDKRLLRSIADPHIGLGAADVWSVARIGVGDPGIHNEDILLAVCMQTGDKFVHFVHGIVDRVQGEIAVAVHVVDVGPHDLQRNAGSTVVGNDLLELLDTLVTPAALVESKRPQRDHARSANHLGVLRNHLARGRAREHVKVRNAANHMIGERLAVLGIDNVHAVRAQQEHPVVGGGAVAAQVEWVGAVQIHVSERCGAVAVPQRECGSGLQSQSRLACLLAEAVEGIGAVERGLEGPELVREEQLAARKHNMAVAEPRDLDGEGRCGDRNVVVERRGGLCWILRARHKMLGHLVAGAVCVGDLDVHAVGGLKHNRDLGRCDCRAVVRVEIAVLRGEIQDDSIGRVALRHHIVSRKGAR